MATGDTRPIDVGAVPRFPSWICCSSLFQPPLYDQPPTHPPSSLAFVVAVRSFSIILDIAGGRFDFDFTHSFLPGAEYSMTLAQGAC
ncbi:hypothetical protein N7475_000765 [Penicillium sp. IBT 31633x]|nr:hypothetical protein N7475_000765 [Penicillium sp. IBT 31633x]